MTWHSERQSGPSYHSEEFLQSNIDIDYERLKTVLTIWTFINSTFHCFVVRGARYVRNRVHEYSGFGNSTRARKRPCGAVGHFCGAVVADSYRAKYRFAIATIARLFNQLDPTVDLLS